MHSIIGPVWGFLRYLIVRSFKVSGAAPGTEADTRHNRSSSTKSMVPPPHEMDLKFFASGQRMEHGQCSGQGDITN